VNDQEFIATSSSIISKHSVKSKDVSMLLCKIIFQSHT